MDPRSPAPLTAADRRAGYFWELCMRQVEVSLTLVFDDPLRALRNHNGESLRDSGNSFAGSSRYEDPHLSN